MNSRDRVLVTGATGLVGSHVVRELLDAGYAVRAMSRTEHPPLPGAEVAEHVRGDIRDPRSVVAALEDCRFLVHAAAAYQLGMAGSRETFGTNVHGTRVVMEAGLRAGVERIVYTSSVATIGPVEGRPATEDDEAGPASRAGPYERSKWLAELLVRGMVTEHGLPAVIVNPATVVGAGDSRPTRTGQLILDAVRGRMPAYVSAGLNFVAAKDVATGHRLALERGGVGQRYILGNENMSLATFLRIIDGVAGQHRRRLRIPHFLALTAARLDDGALSRILHREPTAPLAGARLARYRMYYDSTRAREELGLPATPVRLAVEEAVAWFREVGWLP